MKIVLHGLGAAGPSVKVARVWALIFAACFGLSVARAFCQETQPREASRIEGAKREGKLAWWTPGSAKQLEQVLGNSAKISVSQNRTVESRIIGTLGEDIHGGRAGVHNVDVASIDLENIMEAKKAGLLKKHDWPNARSWASGRYRDPDGYWVARHVLVAVTVYNTQLIPSAEAPKNWPDLLNPKWKGDISIPKDYDWVMMLWSTWGKEKTVNYLKEFAKNKPVVGAGHNARAELLAAGAMKIDARNQSERPPWSIKKRELRSIGYVLIRSYPRERPC
jgi:iron(III) transport system substrate-binding protein